jgi:Tol biopolymer transport system component
VRSRLVPEDANVSFGAGADGRVRLFFVHEATLLAQPVDLGAARLTDQAVEVARPVVPGETGRLAPFAVAANTVVYRRGAASLNRVVLLNRRGERLSVLSDATAEHRYPSVSPGGTSVAVAILDDRTGRLDVWVLDLHRRTRERITSDPYGALFPIWMPDGDTIVYASAESGVFDLHARSVRATTGATVLFGAPAPTVKYPTSLTPDGRYVLFQSGKQQIYRVSLPSDGEMSLLLPGIQGRVSPDGRWLAYTDTEYSVRQVYVTTFPEATERWRISTGSGEDPQWRGDGKELFYIEGGHTLIAVPIRPAPGFQSGPAQALFRAAFPPRVMAWGPSYAPAPDGQQFVVLEADADQEMLLRVTTNWTPGARSGS